MQDLRSLRLGSALVLCAPEGTPLRIRTSGGLASFGFPRMTRREDTYETPGFSAAGGTVLQVEANLGSVRLEWGGTCR